MVVKPIPCAAIDVSKVPDDVRTFNREFAVQLAESLRVNRALVPIAVRPNPVSPERFLLVSGKHRLYATKVVLKEPRIAARIFEDMDDAEAEMARDVENLWRYPLSAAQQAAAIKRWHAHWRSTLPPIPAKEESPRQPEPVPASTATPETKTKESRKSDTHKEATFDQKVADVTGQSVQNVRRAKRVAKAFTEGQLEVFARRGLVQVDMLWVAKIKDKTKRGEVVALVANGRSVADAIEDILGNEAPTRFNVRADAKDRPKTAEAAGSDKETERTDDEWFAQHCGIKAAMLANPARYRSDALLFRAVSHARSAFRSSLKDALAATEASGVTGGLWTLVSRLADISQPNEWPVCTRCHGRGTVSTDDHDQAEGPRAAQEECPRCNGGGYLLCTEGSAWGFGV